MTSPILRCVVTRDKLTDGYRRGSTARWVTLECGHRYRLTGDRALVTPARLRCTDCANLAGES